MSHCKKCNEFTDVNVITGICEVCEYGKPKTAQIWIDQDGLHLEMDKE
jgi:hypothetical protein